MAATTPAKAEVAHYNTRSPSVKRILKEYKDLQGEPSEDFVAAPLDDNIFEWHFTIRGPADTEYEGGLYHGRIILPPEYPMKPPAIILLTPSGRFEVGKKICLSITGFHPEFWQPAWGIRTVCMALISFFPTKGAGAIGALEYSEAERRAIAKRSVKWVCDTCKNDDRMDTTRLLLPAQRKPTGGNVLGSGEPALNISFAYDKPAASPTSSPAPPSSGAAAAPATPTPLERSPSSASASVSSSSSSSGRHRERPHRDGDGRRLTRARSMAAAAGTGTVSGLRHAAHTPAPRPPTAAAGPTAATVSVAALQRQQRLDQMIAFLVVIVIGLVARRLLSTDYGL